MDHSNNTSSSDESPSPLIHKGKRSKRFRALPPPSTAAAASSASSNITDEDHNLADCLMLLSQGCSVPIKQDATPLSKPTEFECKTCSKSFPSFQALGGHRSSHKKLKVADSETNLIGSMEKPIAFSLGVAAGGKQRRHKCSICKAEFSSGQALGGHMRRHRPSLLPVRNLEMNRKENKVLSIDLNLPAPADDESGGDDSANGFQFLE